MRSDFGSDYSGKDQSSMLIGIEDFVSEMISRGGPYLSKWGHGERRHYCDCFFAMLPKWMSVYEAGHEYSEHIEAFWHACEKMGQMSYGRPVVMIVRADMMSARGMSFVEKFASWVLDYAYGYRFRRKAYDRRYEERRRRSKLESYVREILARYARVLVLRIDFGYFKEAPIDISDVYLHMDTLADQIHRRHGAFRNAVGYAWRIEQGRQRGYHIHFCLFLPGHIHQQDGSLAKQIGELWRQISDGKGTYHSCNAEKEKYEAFGRRGVGMISRDDAAQCDNAVNSVCYLSHPEKDDQYLRMKPLGRRSYAKGFIVRLREKMR